VERVRAAVNGHGPPGEEDGIMTITNGLRERDTVELLKAQILELLEQDQDVRDAIAALLQRDDKTKRVFI
jgi:hypothetical protein